MKGCHLGKRRFILRLRMPSQAKSRRMDGCTTIPSSWLGVVKIWQIRSHCTGWRSTVVLSDLFVVAGLGMDADFIQFLIVSMKC